MKITTKEDIKLAHIKPLQYKDPLIPVLCDDATMFERKHNVVKRMQQEQLDVLLIYGDMEHGSNFEYLTGFLTRFEEGMLVLHKDGTAFLMLGNENLNKADKARLTAQAIHVPFFSLPNQPMSGEKRIEDYFKAANLHKGQKVGVVGWKLFTSKLENNQKLFDIPNYLVKAIEHVIGETHVCNRSDIFIGDMQGIRTINNANEIAHYAFGSQLASQCMQHAIEHLEVGVTEIEVANQLSAFGQPHSVVTIAASGPRFEHANLYPSAKTIALQDAISLTVGYKGGLSSRAGYAVHDELQLPKDQQDYLNVIAKPYFAAVCTWLEHIHIGMSGDALYQIIETALPKAQYHWSLNPGHFIADEEWMSSPIYEGSKTLLKSGMLLQIDIIPGIPGYAGVSCESGVALADQSLREQLKAAYPQLYEQFESRRNFMKQMLHINLHEDVLLMNDSVAYYCPFFLNKDLVFIKK